MNKTEFRRRVDINKLASTTRIKIWAVYNYRQKTYRKKIELFSTPILLSVWCTECSILLFISKNTNSLPDK